MVRSKSIPGSGRRRSGLPAKAALRRSGLRKPLSAPRSKPSLTTAGTPRADELARLLVRIERLRRVVTTAFLALKQQNVERDWDIASSLQYSVVDPLFSIEEKGWQLVAALGGKALEDERP